MKSEEFTYAVRRWATESGLIAQDARLMRCVEGQSNHVWRVACAGQPALALKLYACTQQTLLFPNSADDEWAALRIASASGLAPAPIAACESPWGQTILMPWVVGAVAEQADTILRGLRRVHALRAPAGLRSVTTDPATVLAQGTRLMATLPDRVARLLADRRPKCVPTPKANADIAQFLHGDPVPSNVISGPDGTVFIDWQCPASGDPAHDLACALSPSMRLASGCVPLSEDQVDAALSAYGEETTTERFRARRVALTWRFACHAAWRHARGDHATDIGLTAELELLERLDRQ